MNVLILNWRDPKNPKAGGAETVTLEHAKAWVQSGHAVTWLAANFPGAKAKEEIQGITFLRRGNVVTLFLHAILHYLFSSQQYDLVVDEVHGLPFFTPLYVRKPKLAFIHEVAGDIWESMFGFPLNKIGLGLEKLSFLFYKNIPFLTVSESTADDLKKMGARNITVIHNGIVFHTSDKKKAGVPTYIFISRLVKMKGVEDILRAFSYIHRVDNSSLLWIVGTGEKSYVDQLKHQGEILGISAKVMYWGRVSEQGKYDLLKQSQLLLHASVKEGWGLVVIEAASQKTPAVVYNVAGLRDSVKNGLTGIVISSNTPKKLAEEAMKLMQDQQKLKEMQENAYEWAKSLTWERATDASTRLIESLTLIR